VLYNYTNPMMVNCRAVARETGIHCVGLCIGPELIRRELCALIGADPADTWLWAAGLNHFTFAYRLLLDGRDALPLARARVRQARDGAEEELAGLAAAFPSARLDPSAPCELLSPFCADVFENTGVYPGPGDSHVAEFLPQLLRQPADRGEYGLRLFDIGARRKRAAAFLEEFREAAESDGPVDLDALSRGAGGEESQVVRIMEAVRRDSREVFFVNLPNAGQIGNLPAEAVVEGPAVATVDGLKPLVFGELPEPIGSWSNRWVEWGELVVEAALTGNPAKALQAQAADPGCLGFSHCHLVLRELLEANGRWLPRFDVPAEDR
jgi:alpha-galactosidase